MILGSVTVLCEEVVGLETVTFVFLQNYNNNKSTQRQGITRYEQIYLQHKCCKYCIFVIIFNNYSLDTRISVWNLFTTSTFIRNIFPKTYLLLESGSTLFSSTSVSRSPTSSLSLVPDRCSPVA